MRRRTSLIRLGLMVSVLGLGACSTLPSANTGLTDASRSTALKSSDDAQASTWLAPLGEAGIGDVVSLGSDNPLGVSRIRLQSEYAAASGRTCRRFVTANREFVQRLACRQGEGDWELVRGLVATSR